MHINLVISAPHEQKTIRGREIENNEVEANREISRISPYPPSFRRMAARIIEPATGAST